MFQPNGSTIECDTCLAANTSACSECIVSYVLANDDGPVEYVPAPEPEGVAVQLERGTIAGAVDLFVRAGLVDEPVTFVTVAEFESGVVQPRADLVLRG